MGSCSDIQYAMHCSSLSCCCNLYVRHPLHVKPSPPLRLSEASPLFLFRVFLHLVRGSKGGASADDAGTTRVKLYLRTWPTHANKNLIRWTDKRQAPAARGRLRSFPGGEIIITQPARNSICAGPKRCEENLDFLSPERQRTPLTSLVWRESSALINEGHRTPTCTRGKKPTLHFALRQIRLIIMLQGCAGETDGIL